jgi:hypothetical protein
MSKQCPNCRKISSASVVSCDKCGFTFIAKTKGRLGLAEACVKIGIAVTLVASVTAVIAKLI